MLLGELDGFLLLLKTQQVTSISVCLRELVYEFQAQVVDRLVVEGEVEGEQRLFFLVVFGLFRVFLLLNRINALLGELHSLLNWVVEGGELARSCRRSLAAGFCELVLHFKVIQVGQVLECRVPLCSIASVRLARLIHCPWLALASSFLPVHCNYCLLGCSQPSWRS